MHSNRGAGAGANANSKANMMKKFVGSDTLAELVWSPRTGLNIKFAENKPCCMWKEVPSETRFLDTQNEQHIAALAGRHVSDEVVKSSSCTGSQNQGAEDALFQHLFESGVTSNVCAERRSPLKIEPVMQCGPQEHFKKAQDAIFEDENDEKHEESCRRANFLTERKRKCSFQQQLILESKRIKKQADEYATKTDNSFMNWISNMLKELKSCNVYDQNLSVSNETQSLKKKETGFRSVFLPVFSPEWIDNKSIGRSVLSKGFSQESVVHMEIQNEKAGSLVKQVCLYRGVSKEAPKGMFDTIRRLRLSRTDIHKWMNSRLPVSQLDGFFLRLRVAKWQEGAEGSRYHVACITGLQRETPWKDLKQPIRVKVGDVECFIESQHVSNCDFIEDELIAWWQKTSKNQRIPVVKDLKSKLAVRRTLGM